MKDLNHLFGRIPVRRKLLILTIGLATVPLVCLFVLTFLVGFTELRTLALRNLESEARAIRNRITGYFTKIEHDVRYLSSLPSLQAYFRAGHDDADTPARRMFAEHLLQMARTNPGYYQLRLLDPTGSELVRVNREEGELRVVPRDQLQNKAHRYYFREAMRLPPGGVYVSPMDYNVEHHHLERPHVPVFRYATPVTLDDTRQGVFIINVFGRTVLDLLAEQGGGTYQRLRLLDQHGRVIVSGIDNEGALDLSLDLSLDLERTSAENSRALSQLITGSPWFGDTRADFFVRVPINPIQNGSPDYWSLVLRGKRTPLLQPFYRLARYGLAFLGICSLAAALAGLYASRHFYRPLMQLRNQAHRVSEGDYRAEASVATNDELEDLARDFARMAGALDWRERQLQRHQRELEQLVRERTFQIELEKEKLERLVEGVGAGLALFDQNRSLSWYNEYFAKLFHGQRYAPGEACCRIFSDELGYCLCDGGPDEHCPVQAALEGTPREQPAKKIRCADGRVRTFLDRVSPIRNSDGEVLYALHILYDITDKELLEERQRALQQQLERAEKLATLGRFTAGIAHEIGNPLGIISTNAQAIQEQVAEDSVQWHQLELIVSEIQRLSKITRDLNSFGKPSPPTLQLHRAADILAGMTSLVRKEAAAGKVEMVTTVASEPATVRVDAQQLQQVLLNLVLNALEAMPDGGRLSLETTVEPAIEGGQPQVRFAVSDTGAGIPADKLEAIFDPFYTTKPQGTGFGLALASTIVHQNGGALTVSSTPGEGATFTILLPLVEHGVEAVPSETGRAAVHRAWIREP